MDARRTLALLAVSAVVAIADAQAPAPSRPSRGGGAPSALREILREEDPALPAAVQEAYLKASNTDEFDNFGAAVAVDGQTLVISAPYEDSGATGVDGDQDDDSTIDAGAVYVFEHDGTTWVQTAYLKAADTTFIGSGDGFGVSLALCDDTLVVGCVDDSAATGIDGDATDNSAFRAGAAYVFVRDGATWTQQAYLKPSNTGAEDYFGASVAIAGDTIVVGALREDSDATGVDGDAGNDDAEDSGAAYVFVRSGTTWTQQAYLKASNTDPDDSFGWSVAISGDTVLVSAPQENGDSTGVNGSQGNAPTNPFWGGAVYVFVRDGGSWTQEAYLKASNTGAGDYFGLGIALCGDRALIAAPFEDSAATGIDGDGSDNGATDAGAAYLFTRTGTLWTQEAYVKASNAGTRDWFALQSVALAGDTMAIGARDERSNAQGVDGPQGNDDAVGSGAAYVYRRAGGSWSQVAYLKSSNSEAQDQFGHSVALGEDLVVVGADYEASNATGVGGNQADDSAPRAGAVYAFRLAKDETLVLDFETEDDGVTPLVNGQEVTTPPAFGNVVAISASGPNWGPAIFDSDPAGPNAGGPDPDLLVDLGNVLILQEDPTQTTPWLFDLPDDALLGGTLRFDFLEPAELLSIDLIDVCPGPPLQDVTVELVDQALKTRTYHVPGGWTGDVPALPPGHGTLDLTTLAPQPGLQATATAAQDRGFDASGVVSLRVHFASSGAVDRLELRTGTAPRTRPALPSQGG